jgi:lipoprotein
MNKFARICFSIGLFGVLICFIIIGCFLSNSDMTIEQLLSSALSTMDTFTKVTGVTAIVIGIVLVLQNYIESVVSSEWKKELSDKEIFLLEKFRRADHKVQSAIINILKEPLL